MAVRSLRISIIRTKTNKR